MSASLQQEDAADRYDEDIEENDQPNAEEAEGELLSSGLSAPNSSLIVSKFMGHFVSRYNTQRRATCQKGARPPQR